MYRSSDKRTQIQKIERSNHKERVRHYEREKMIESSFYKEQCDALDENVEEEYQEYLERERERKRAQEELEEETSRLY
jgi:hypothetical protein